MARETSNAPVIKTHKASKAPIETEFRYGNVIIPAAFDINRKRFEKMFKGKVKNLDGMWTEYQAWCKRNK